MEERARFGGDRNISLNRGVEGFSRAVENFERLDKLVLMLKTG